MTQDPNELTKVEQPFFEQLQTMGWDYLQGDVDVPYITERESFRDTLLIERLKKALQKLNPWMGDQQMTQATRAITHLTGTKLMERNQAAMELLVKGVPVDVDPDLHGIKTKTARLFDFDEATENDFLAINQFRVDILGSRSFCIPDLVLFVNGIPLVVVECKNPSASNPVEAAITDLLKYSNQRDNDEQEGVERLFDFNLFMVATTFYEARSGTIGARPKHYMEWKDTSPVPMSEYTESLGIDQLSSQQMMIAGMLHPDRILDLLHNFVLFTDDAGRTIKIIARYQQYRAVHAALRNLQNKQTKLEHGDEDQRGGIVWHTQGSGKSLTMVFLIRVMRTLEELRAFKIVVITDRRSLHKQLMATAELTGEPITEPKKVKFLPDALKKEGKDLVFTLIQRMQDIVPPTEKQQEYIKKSGINPSESDADIIEPLDDVGVLNESESILLLVDEAHRSHGSTTHASMMKALPNCAKIGFTGTPIMEDDKVHTTKIFGGFIDVYTIKQSQDDGATVPIRYEGWIAEGELENDQTIDEIFDEAFSESTAEEREAIKDKYVKKSTVREAKELVAEHARHILRDYVANAMPNGFKAQLVAVTRRAAIKYQAALDDAREELIREIDDLDPQLDGISDEEIDTLDADEQFLVRAARRMDTIQRLEFGAVISPSKNDPGGWNIWSNRKNQEKNIARFKRPLVDPDPEVEDGFAIVCVKSMLLTGFDAPVNQTLYVDRFMQGYELLQAIARVNRNYDRKTVGRVVDFFGVAWHLGEALRVYSAEDRKEIAQGLSTIRDELNRLDDRHKKVTAIFSDQLLKLSNEDDCVGLLRSEKVRADFILKLQKFMKSLDTLRFHPKAKKYIDDAKQLGFINKSAANLYRDRRAQLAIADCGEQVRELIDQHITAVDPRQKIPPVDLLAPEFEEEVNRHHSDRAKAAAMAHAADEHLSEKVKDEDPVLYRAFSERLQKILTDFKDNWTKQIEAFKEYLSQLQAATNQEVAGLSPHTQVPFFRAIMNYVDQDVDNESVHAKYAGITVEIIEHIKQEIRHVGFWQSRVNRKTLSAWIEVYLYDHDIIDDFDSVPKLADELVNIAKAKHTSLIQ